MLACQYSNSKRADDFRLRRRSGAGRSALPLASSGHSATTIQRAATDPRLLSASDVLQLQRAIGNQAVGRVLASVTQRQQANDAARRHKDGSAVDAGVGAAIQQARSGGQPLADGVRVPMQQAFGADFGGVKVHNDARADHLNHLIQAKAFTTGQDIFFRQGAYEPGSRRGQELIAHELAHVAQQTETPGARKGVVQRFALQGATSAPRIDLDTEEDNGGHSIDRHVSKSRSYLVGRAQTDANVTWATTYNSQSVAESVTQVALNKGWAPLQSHFTAGVNANIALVSTMKKSQGIGYNSKGKSKKTDTIHVWVGRRTVSGVWQPNDFFVESSYPFIG